MQSSSQEHGKKTHSEAIFNIENSVKYNEQDSSFHEMKLYPLKSSRYLIQQFSTDEKTINFYLCDLTAKTSERIYQHKVKEKNDHYRCYLPEGPVLKHIQDEINIKREKLFEYRLAVEQPEYYKKTLSLFPQNNIAYIGNDYFIVMNKDSYVLTDNMLFDVFLEKNGKITSIKKLKNNYALFPNPLFSSFSDYQWNVTDQILCASEDILCIVHHDDRLDIWKKTHVDEFELYASLSLKEKLKTKNKVNLFCVTQTFDNHLICQAQIETPKNPYSSPYAYFLKINLSNKKLVKIGKINIEHNIFDEINEITPIKNSNLFIGRDYRNNAFLIDAEAFSVQELKLPMELEYGALTDSGNIIAFNENTIQEISYPSIQNFLSFQKKEIDNLRIPVLNKVMCRDLVNIVNDYVDDYCNEPSKVNLSLEDKQSPLILLGHFGSYYKEKDMLDKSIRSPFEFKSDNIKIKKIFK